MSEMLPFTRSPLRSMSSDLFEDLDRIRTQLLDTFGAPSRTAVGWTPALSDLEEKDDEYLVHVEMPGFDRDDIRIEMEGRRLMVHAEREEEQEREGSLRSSTRSSGRLHHEVVLPSDVDQEGIEASLDKGVLTIRIPRSEKAERRRIEIS